MAHSKMLDKASVQIPCGIIMVPGDCPMNEKRCFPPRSVTTTPRNQSDTTTSPLLFSVMYLGITYILCLVLLLWIVWVSCPDLYWMTLLGIWPVYLLNILTSRSPDVGEQYTQRGCHVESVAACINVVFDFISFDSFFNVQIMINEHQLIFTVNSVFSANTRTWIIYVMKYATCGIC